VGNVDLLLLLTTLYLLASLCAIHAATAAATFRSDVQKSAGLLFAFAQLDQKSTNSFYQSTVGLPTIS
jgi:hypothetical protein